MMSSLFKSLSSAQHYRCLQLAFLLLPAIAYAEPELDIRVSSPLQSNESRVDYVLSVSDCTDLKAVLILDSNGEHSMAPTDATRVEGDSQGCEFSFTLEGNDRYNPSVTISHIDGSSESYSEIFTWESIQPSIAIDRVAISENGGEQSIALDLTADDNTDLAYLSIRITGIRASDLRRSGGVVQKAKDNAFIDTGESIRIYPTVDNQKSYVFSYPLTTRLSGDEIAHNALAIIEARAVDASGNQNVVSEIRYLGDTVDEKVLGMSVAPERLMFTDVLQFARLIPSLDYEFRGATPVPGLGQGITYTSSDPSSVLVTQDGVVYPLQETGTNPVELSINYPGMDQVVVPVTVNFSRNLVGLNYAGQDEGPFVLSSLNEFTPLPSLIAKFDDGTDAPLNDSTRLVYRLDDSASGILTFDKASGLRASAVVSQEAPLYLHINLQADQAISLDIPVISKDAPPKISFTPPVSVSVGETLRLASEVKDDVGISAVEFWMDGQRIARRTMAPYELSLPITQDLEGRQLLFYSTAFDTSGQSVNSDQKQVRIEKKKSDIIPDFKLEKPLNNQRIVESSPFYLTVTSNIGLKGQGKTSSGIKYVEYFAEGKKIGESYYPILEERADENDPRKLYIYEVWRVQGQAPSISTKETSLNISAKIHTQNGSEAVSEYKLIRILKNEKPIASVIKPVAGTTVTVGQTVNVVIEAADDVLGAGATIALMVDGQSVSSYRS